LGQIVRLGAFLVVPVIGVWILRSSGRSRRAAVSTLATYILVMHGIVVARIKESWPFSNYQVLHGPASLDVPLWRVDFMGIDRQGREWPIDSEAWDATSQIPLQLWVHNYFMRLHAPERRQVMAFLYGVAESSRQRVKGGQRVGSERWLGPLAAPYWYSMERHRAVPDEPYAGLRIVDVSWTAREFRRPGGERRAVLGSYSP
jgi:hypothetical protein